MLHFHQSTRAGLCIPSTAATPTHRAAHLGQLTAGTGRYSGLMSIALIGVQVMTPFATGHGPPTPPSEGKREPTTALAELTQIMCVSVVKHMHKDTKGHGRGDHLARGAAPEVEP
jgi:hypothetical protein